MAAKLPYSAGMFVCEIEGQAAGHCTSVSGGQYKAELATQKTSIGFERKNISALSLEPLSLELGLGMGKGMIEWMRSYVEGTDLRKSGIIHACDYSGKSMAIREFMNAQITELSFPALDATSKDMGKVTVKLAPEKLTMGKGPGSNVGATLAKAQKQVSLQSFAVEIGGLPCDNVTKVDAIKLETKFAKAQTGKKRDYVITPSSKTISNIKLTINNEDLAEWEDWYRKFVIDGECSDDDELTGSITFLAQNQKTELLRIDLAHLGCISLDWGKAEAAKDGVACFTVEMYCEELKFDLKAVV